MMANYQELRVTTMQVNYGECVRMAEMTGGQVFKMLENKKDLGSTKSEKYARVLERMPQEHLLLCFSLRAMLIFT